MSQKIKFEVGSYIVVPPHGVCAVLWSTTGDAVTFDGYVVQCRRTGAKIVVHTHNVHENGVRHLMSESEATTALSIMTGQIYSDAPINWMLYPDKRYRYLVDVSQRCNWKESAGILRDYLFSDSPFSCGERKTIDKIKEALSLEIACVRKISASEAMDLIDEALLSRKE